jgi:hypothetical protein
MWAIFARVRMRYAWGTEELSTQQKWQVSGRNMADFFDVWSGENQVWKTTVFVDWLFFCLFARVHQSGRLHLDGSRTVSIYTRSDGSLRKPRSGLPGQFENAASKSTLSIAQRSTRRCHRQIPGDMDILYAGKKCRIVSPSSWENRSI